MNFIHNDTTADKKIKQLNDWMEVWKKKTRI